MKSGGNLWCLDMKCFDMKYDNLQEDAVITNELDSTCGISDEELTYRFNEAIRIDEEIRKIKGLPVARYDSKEKRAYLEYPDGRREYVED